MALNVFGFTIKRQKEDIPENIPSVVSPDSQDGAVVVGADGAGYYGYAFNPLGEVKTENDLLRRYREVAAYPEVDQAINEIVDEAIVFDDNKFPVELNLEQTKLPDSIKKKFNEEFDSILHLLEFDIKGHDIFRQFYVDGKLHYHVVFEGENFKRGIADVRFVDPRKIKKVRNIKKEKSKAGVEISKTVEEYYLYNDKGIDDKTQSGIKLTKDSVVFVTSGLIDQNNGLVLSHLQKAIKPANQLKMVEDAVVIYRLTRAPERRIFYVDVGSLPKGKAEQYVTELMNKFRNKLVYDAATGEIADSKRHMSMMEDFWMPRRDGCFSLDTKIELLDGRSVELGQLIVEYKLGKTNWVYSISPEGKVVPGMISWAGVTRNDAEVMQVKLDNGKIITCTPDHKFILRNGTIIQAKDLQPGASLMPFNSSKKKINKTSNTYHTVEYNDGSGEQFTHRMVYEYFNPDDNSAGVIHHVDFDRYNNNPENLVKMGRKEHFALHSSAGRRGWSGNTELHIQRLSESGKKFFETEAGQKRKQEISEFNQKCERVWEGLQTGRQTIKEMRAHDKVTLSHEEYLKKWSPGLDAYQKAGTEAAKAKLEFLRETMSESEYKQFCSRFQSSRNRMKSFHDTLVLSDIIAIIVDAVNDNPRIGNPEIVRLIGEQFHGITLKKLRRYLAENGYESISDVIVRNCAPEVVVDKRRFNAVHDSNHTVVEIISISDRMDVGTLTIDENHLYHDHHNFALTDGVFVMNSKGTEITTLQGGQNLAQLDDVEYFKNKLMRSLNVPITRLQPEQNFSLGRSNEISRDELKFHKFIKRLRARFSVLFIELLKIQLVSKGIININDWESISKQLVIEYRKDNQFSELKDLEVLNNRLAALAQIDQYVGKYYSMAFVRKNVLRLSEEEIKDLEDEIKQEPDPNEGNENE